MFEKFVNDVANMPVDNPQMVELGIANNPAINAELLKSYILTDTPVSNEEMYHIVRQSYKDVLKCIVDLKIGEYLEYCTTPKFITVLQEVIRNLQEIDNDTRRYCNRIAYDYITMFSKEESSEHKKISQMMMDLSQLVNRDTIIKLNAIGLPNELSSWISLARYSSENESTNIMRVNFIVCRNIGQHMKFDLSDMRESIRLEQLIVNIFEKLYDRLAILFESIMFDVYPMDAEWMTENIGDVYGIISLAILDILENMPVNMIVEVLKIYSNDYLNVRERKGSNCIRFSMKSLSWDYPRINNVVEVLKSQGIYLP